MNKEDHDEEEISFEFEDVEYKGNIRKAWTVESGLFRRKFEYWLIFYKVDKETFKKSKKEWVDPVLPIDQAKLVDGSERRTKTKFQFITANLLYQIEKYRGVNPAFKEEFKIDRQFDVPRWAIIPVLIVLISASVLILWRVGAIDDILRSFR
jgi:hypothetical protein